jgi:hypothetical protein
MCGVWVVRGLVGIRAGVVEVGVEGGRSREPSQVVRSFLDMSTKAIEPEPSEWLRLLTGNRLQTQVSHSGVLVGGALGAMGVDVAFALIVIGGGGAYALSILALLALGSSFGLAVRALLLPSAKEAGPTLAAMRRAREAEDARAFEDSLLDDLEEDIEANEHALARKTLLFKGALTFLAFAILVELAGQVVR